MLITQNEPWEELNVSESLGRLWEAHFELERKFQMTKPLPWHQIIQDTKKAALAAAELSASLYRLARALQFEADKQQKAMTNGTKTPQTP